MRLGHRHVRARPPLLAAAAAVLLLAAIPPPPAAAATLIRDAEIEETVAGIAHPLFAAARLDPEGIDVYLVRDDRLNAFVAGGQNLFLNTGLLLRAATPDQLAGVIAHETGHIAGGHLSRATVARERATVESLVGAVLGAAAAVAGAPQVGTAIIAGGATLAQRGLLSFTRSQEQAADQAAIGLLASTGRSPRGMLEFFRVLEGQNLRISAEGQSFLRTHPLTRDRIAFIESKLAESPFREAPPDPAAAQAHERMVAKLDGFLAEPAAVLRRRAGDGLPDRYARAVAYFRLADLKRSLATLDGLIAERPADPWFLELKGQVLFESGRIDEAGGPYREALRLRPEAPLLRLGLARTLMEQGGGPRLEEASALLKEAVRLEPDNAGAWRFLGVAQGQLGREGEASLSLAESAVLGRRKEDAELHLRRAQSLIKPADPAWYRVQDLIHVVAEMEDPEPPPERPRRRPF